MDFHDTSLSVAQAVLRAQGRQEEQPEAPTKWSITVSREEGALGTAVAREVGRQLGWPVYDHEILRKIADAMKRPEFRIRSFDERPLNWLEECFSALFTQSYISFSAFYKHLAVVVRGLGLIGHCVIVGRASSFLLPPETTLRIRLVADRETRIRNIAAREGLTPQAAAELVDAKEKERAAFIKDHFKLDPADPLHYDLVLNTSRLSIGACAHAIIEALKSIENASARRREMVGVN